MLLSVHVKNLALIDEVEMNFENHLNILTGETGAGKSCLLYTSPSPRDRG